MDGNASPFYELRSIVLHANCENGPEVHLPHASAVVSNIVSVSICGLR